MILQWESGFKTCYSSFMKKAAKFLGKSLARTILVVTEIVAAFCLIFLALVVFSLWKLSQGPVDITFAADYVRDALVSDGDNTTLEFDSIVAELPKRDGPIVLGMSGVKLLENDFPVLEVPRMGVQIAKVPLFIGLIKPQAVTVSEPTVKLYRSKAGDFHLFVTEVPAPQAAAETEKQGQENISLKEIGESFFKGGNLPDYPALSTFSQIERVNVKNATILVDDHQAGISWEIPQVNFDLKRAADKFDLTLSYQEKGKQQQTETNKEKTEKEEANPLSEVKLSLNKDASNKDVKLDATLTHINSPTLARMLLPFRALRDQKFVIDGQATGMLDKDWKLQELNIKVSSDSGSLRLDELMKMPLDFSNLSANMTLDKNSNVFVVKDTTLDVNGSTISLSGEKKLESDSPYFPLTISVSSLDFKTIHSLWPEEHKTTPLGEWMTAKLSDATISGLKVTLPVNLSDLADMPIDDIKGEMSYKNLTADYRAPMIHVSNAAGKVTYQNDTLDITVDSGNIADLAVKKGRVQITHLAHPTNIGDVIIDADLAGPVAAVLEYIEREPINVGEETIGLKKETVKGNAELKAHVTFPALADLPADQVKVKVDATMNNVLLPKLVHGLDLSGGPYAVVIDEGMITVSGKGQLDKQPIDLSYSEYLEHKDAPFFSKIKASLVSDQKIRAAFGANLSQFISGNVPIEVEYVETKKGHADIDLKGDLTPASFYIDPLAYLKNPGVKGSVSGNIQIRNHDISSIKNLRVSVAGGTSAIGAVTFGRVDKIWDVANVNLSAVKLNHKSDFALNLTQKERNTYNITVTGKTFDASPFIGGGDQAAVTYKKKREELLKKQKGGQAEQGTAVNATVNVVRLLTGPEKDQFLTSPAVSLSTNHNGDITSLDARGNTPHGRVAITMKPDSGKAMTMEISASNAGEALHALDIYDRMKGGQLRIRGKQISGAGINDLRGYGEVSNFTVVKAPVLAKLINLFSISGLVELLQNKGIEFSKLKTDFEWKNKNGSRVILLKNGRTAGASIGLSFEGTVNQTNSTMNLSGTVVPMSEVNNFFARIPLIGKLLTGSKDGGLIAATYTMKGPTSDPKVFLNPLSVLAPGFLRSLLFENDSNDAFSDETKTTPKLKKRQYNQ